MDLPRVPRGRCWRFWSRSSQWYRTPAPRRRAQPSDWSFAEIDLPNGAVDYDATRDRVLVAVSPSVPGLGNRLVEIDPGTGELGRSVFVGADPYSIAVAGDWSRAYVGLLGSPTIVEVDLASFTVTRRFGLGRGAVARNRYAHDIEVQPGSPEIIAVSMRNLGVSPMHEGVAVFDEGVRRPDETSGHTGPTTIAWGEEPGELYGFNDKSTSYGFYKLAIDGDGVSVSEEMTLITGFDQEIEFGAGLVHAEHGQVVNPDTMSLVGEYSTGGALAIDEDHRAVFTYGEDGTLARHQVDTQIADWTHPGLPALVRPVLLDTGDGLVAADAETIVLLGPDVAADAFSMPPGKDASVRDLGRVPNRGHRPDRRRHRTGRRHGVRSRGRVVACATARGRGGRRRVRRHPAERVRWGRSRSVGAQQRRLPSRGRSRSCIGDHRDHHLGLQRRPDRRVGERRARRGSRLRPRRQRQLRRRLRRRRRRDSSTTARSSRTRCPGPMAGPSLRSWTMDPTRSTSTTGAAPDSPS
ncbi:MAG: hypothetical protein U5R31_00865 [Acidimicrobiia bacterium]|nr:hypothetical protein [Acidimicrobiia bacterium]